MRSWFTPHDTIGLENERIVDDEMTQEDMIQLVMKDLKLYKAN